MARPVNEGEIEVDERGRRLERHVTWTESEACEFDARLKEQRAVDEDLWGDDGPVLTGGTE